jgi:hypothetical protein
MIDLVTWKMVIVMVLIIFRIMVMENNFHFTMVMMSNKLVKKQGANRNAE